MFQNLIHLKFVILLVIFSNFTLTDAYAQVVSVVQKKTVTDKERELAWENVRSAYKVLGQFGENPVSSLYDSLSKYLLLETEGSASLAGWQKHFPPLVDLFNDIYTELQTMPDVQTLRARELELRVLNIKKPNPGETIDSPQFLARWEAQRKPFVEADDRLSRRIHLERDYKFLVKGDFMNSYFPMKDEEGVTWETLLPRKQFAERLKDEELKKKLFKRIAELELIFPPPKKTKGK